MAESYDETQILLSLTTGSLVGRELLIRQLESSGVEAPDEFLDKLLYQAAAALPQVSSDDKAALATAIDEALPVLLNAAPDLAAVVDDASAIAEERVESFGAVGDALLMLAGLTAAIGVLLMVSKLKMGFEWQGGDVTRFTVELEGGVPAGFRDVVGPLVELMGAATGNPQRTSGDRDGPAGGRSALPRPNIGTLTSSSSDLTLKIARGELPQEPMTFEAGLQARDYLLSLLREQAGDITALAAREFEDNIFCRELMGFAKPGALEGQPLLWPFATDLAFGVGLLPEAAPPDEKPPRFLLAVRMQSAREVQPRVVRWLSNRMKGLTPLVSLRWISPVITLGRSNPHGVFQPWNETVPGSGLVTSGAPLNVAGGAIGSCTAILSDGVAMYALTAGHPIRDTDPRIIQGEAVYCAPQSCAPGPYARIGVVEDGATFDRRRMGQITGTVSGRGDFALIKLDDGVISPHDPVNIVDGQALAKHIVTVPTVSSNGADAAALGLQGRRVIKSKAKSDSLKGYLNAIALRIDCIDRILNGAVSAHGLVEVVMDANPGGGPLPGDSGAMLSVINPVGPAEPMALVFGAQTAGRLDGAGQDDDLDRVVQDDDSMTSIYGVPLAAIEPVRGMRIV